MSLKFEKIYTLPSDLSFVWECIADEDTCGLWQGQDCEIGNEKGDAVSLFGGQVIGEILTIEEEKLLKYTWRGDDWDSEWEDSIVSYEFSEENNMTHVKVIHNNFPNEQELKSHAMGWDTYFFEPLEEFIIQSSD